MLNRRSILQDNPLWNTWSILCYICPESIFAAHNGFLHAWNTIIFTSGLKYAFVDDGHGATGCLSSDQFLSLDIVDAPDSCTVFRKASMTWMGDSSTADANGEDIFSIFESFCKWLYHSKL